MATARMTTRPAAVTIRTIRLFTAAHLRHPQDWQADPLRRPRDSAARWSAAEAHRPPDRLRAVPVADRLAAARAAAPGRGSSRWGRAAVSRAARTPDRRGCR